MPVKTGNCQIKFEASTLYLPIAKDIPRPVAVDVNQAVDGGRLTLSVDVPLE